MEIETKRNGEFSTLDTRRVRELEYFLFTDYPRRLDHIQRCVYLGITPDEKLYDLQTEAYIKEQEYRLLTGKKPLEEIKTKKII